MQIKINALDTPFIDSAPRFSWQFPQDTFSPQTSCTLTLALDAAFADVVYETTRETEEHANLYIDYQPRPLTKYFVRVTAALANGQTHTAETYFRTGFMETPWDAKYITCGSRRRDEVLYALYLRKDFTAAKVKEALLYIVGLGYFEAHINGKKVGDDFQSIPYTTYDKTILYRAFDVTDMIAEGGNAIGVILGNGFYNCFTQDPWQTNTAPWRDVPKLQAELHLIYDDHTEKVITDNTWQGVDGPIRFNGIRHGEEYDARMEKDGWDMPGYAGETIPVRWAKHPAAHQILMEMEPIRVRKVLTPTVCRKVKNGWLYELPQNIAGLAEITFRGKAGTRYTLRYCDKLYPDGELDQESLSGFIKNYTFQTDVYTKRTDEPETWHAIFTYYGFQYIELTGVDEPIAKEDIRAMMMCNDFAPRAHFTCSDETINYIEHMVHAATLSCCMHTLSADAVREKCSWTGDTGLSAEQLMINYHAENFMKKWQQDLRDTQRVGGALPCIVPTAGWGYNGNLNGPDWSHPMVDVPWNLYREYGDLTVLRDNYKALCAHVSYIRTMAHDLIPSFGLGDWCAPFDGPALSVNMESFKCPVPVSDTAFFHSAAKNAAMCAKLLGYEEDEAYYTALASDIKAAFRKNFFDKETYTVAGDCQSATGLMVYHGLAEEDEIPGLVEKLVSQIARDNGHLDFGVLGCKAVMETLGKYGYAQLAMDLLTNPTYPSMKHWMDMGATTLFECWNGEGSHNHHMFSPVSAFFHKFIAGLAPAAPGYKKIDFRPAVDTNLTHAYADVETPYGKAACGFEKKDGKTTVTLTVPASCSGTLYLGNTTRVFDAGVHTVTL